MELLKDKFLFETRAFIAGRWETTGTHIEVRNPATGVLLAEVADCTRADATRAIEAARLAQADWAQRTGKNMQQSCVAGTTP